MENEFKVNYAELYSGTIEVLKAAKIEDGQEIDDGTANQIKRLDLLNRKTQAGIYFLLTEHNQDLDTALYNKDVSIHEGGVRELAYSMIDEGLFGEIPDHILSYIDYTAIIRHLRHDNTEFTFDGLTWTGRAD